MRTTPTSRALALGLGLLACIAAAAPAVAATTGISTQQARTAAPPAIDGTQTTNSEGSALSFMRSDARPATVYTAPFTGAIARAFASKFGDTISVKDFPAVGDGLTDDSAAMQLACNAAAGRRLYLPNGVYRISQTMSCNAELLWFEAGAQLSIDATKIFTATNHVVSLGGDPTMGSGTMVYGNDSNLFANDNGFSFGKTPSVGSDDFFHIRRDIQGSTGIIIRNDDFVGTTTDSYIHMYGGPLTGVNQGSSMRLSAGNLANNGGLVNIVAENDAAFSLIQQSAAPLDLYTANVRQFQIASVPSAVNYWQFKGALAGSSVSVIPAGTDTNISAFYDTKGTGSIFFRTNGAIQGEVKNTTGATNRVTWTGSNGGAPTIGTSGGNLALTATTNIVSAPSLSVTSTTGAGSITLAAGTGTATVNSGARCVCSDTTANASCKASVSATTLTVTGTGTDVVNYFCF